MVLEHHFPLTTVSRHNSRIKNDNDLGAIVDFRILADRVAADVARGRLRPGDRLPTQRRFARDHRIAVSTAARVYAELTRRGVVVGEVGRGTFVRAAAPTPEPALAEPAHAPVDLELNFPVLPEQPGLLAPAIESLSRPDILAAALAPLGVRATAELRAQAGRVLARPGWTPPDLIVTGSGRHAIGAAFAGLVPTGGRIAVEALTYPLVRGIAHRLGLVAVPVALDDEGMVPGALDAVCSEAPVHAVSVQPTLHNPLGVTMSEQRRAAVAAVLRAHGVVAVEDAVYSFLRPDPGPLAAHAPERTVVVDSLSKRVAPGLTLGFVAGPPELTERIGVAARTAGYGPQGLAVAAATRWLSDGVVDTLVAGKRADAAARQTLARRILPTLRADPAAYHAWLPLPDPWRAETFVAAAARRGIAVTPAAAFAVIPAHSPNAVRLALSAPSPAQLERSLHSLATLLRATPDLPD
ncbi:DNA-binding transcriptional regulator, MocR family, contains an aminotransferase domain [Pseudonocardia oroxyli]|uniref:DNA-binding transcriptional regulator, MocR family, contains an aminotransferase domain n=1 Tax=Pseudonocardia oroxyli TaxID=366584 RepID=A0A1G7JYA1_PSEOR|nr:DNA-binding transcriptional regulator, MocR family, contains an aminotransferase domain [Pseudonocardia oroxyli]